jgi:uncharacterized protein
MLPRLVRLAALLVFASPALAVDEPVLIGWSDLIPVPDEPTIPDALVFDDLPDAPDPAPFDPELGGVVEHGGTVPGMSRIDQDELVTKYDDVQVKIAGYVLPVEFEGTRVRQFLLVPYVGACIHVPPPPPNQIIFVTSEEGIEVTGMFEAVWATGRLKTTSLSSELADIGYRMTLDDVASYE